MAKRIKQEAVQFAVPQSQGEAAEAIAEIGRRQRERQRLEADMNDELAAAKQKYEEAAAPHNNAIRELSKGVQTWCEANRALLTIGGKVKFAHLSSGTVKWRMRPPRVVVRGVETVIELIKKLGLADPFVRIKEEINKEAILADPEAVKAVPGIKIEKGEDFVIVPFESQLEEVA